MQFRKELAEFEKAAGGTAVSVQSPSTADTVPTATPPEVRPTDPTAPPATTPPTATPPSTTPPSTTTPPATAAPTTTPETGAQMAGNAEILRHIAAIEAMLKVEDDSGGVTLTKVQLEQLRTHLASLRAAIEKK
jgi:hypothetical protein